MIGSGRLPSAIPLASAVLCLSVGCGNSTRHVADGRDGSGGMGGSAGTWAGGATGGADPPPECFTPSACCSEREITIIETTDCRTTLVFVCPLGCAEEGACIALGPDVTTGDLCRDQEEPEPWSCSSDYDCLTPLILDVGQLPLQSCDRATGDCVSTDPVRPADFGESCGIADLASIFAQPALREQYVVESSGCENGICWVDEGDGTPRDLCTQPCMVNGNDCPAGYECEWRSTLVGPHSAVAVCAPPLE